MDPISKRRFSGLLLFLAMGSWPLVLSQETPQTKKDGLPRISQRGPGMQGPVADLKLPVPRTFDLTHVETVHFAEALGKDPQRIFEFVRDHVAFEAYTGCLRGPRGTLLAMAGNSLDRALLLADLLEKSGKKLRFARGALAEADARKLVDSMWAGRPRVKADAEMKPETAVKAALETLKNCVTRDYQLLRSHLKKLDNMPLRQSAPGTKDLVKETQPHYWVQWYKGDSWMDLDPSFADSMPGKTHAKTEETLAALPEGLYHRVTIRIELEECEILLAGNEPTKPSKREILRFTATAADLAGVDLILTHQPENWQKPAASIEYALTRAIQDTGKVKPVLLTSPKKWLAGSSFRQKLPAAQGLGGIGNLLGGAGKRTPVAIAISEVLAFDFIAPSGDKETVVRPIFDWVGVARRGAAEFLNSEEVRAKAKMTDAIDVRHSVVGLCFFTGGLEESHLAKLAKAAPLKKGKSSSARKTFRDIHIAMAALSDKLLANISKEGRTVVRFYPDSPRLQIVDLTRAAGKQRLTIDLRRDSMRALDRDERAGTFSARVFYGVVHGTVERVLGDYIASRIGQKKLTAGWSTSSLFDQVSSEGIPTRVFRDNVKTIPNDLPQDTQARLRATLAKGFLVVAPQRGIRRGTQLRSAWWQINPRTGETLAVTDEGLHQAAVERSVLVGSEEDGEVTVVVEDYFEGNVDRTFFTVREEDLVTLLDYLGDIDHIMFTW